MKNIYYYLAFSHFLGIGPMKFRKLLDTFGDVKQAYEASFSEIKPLIGEKTAADFIDFKNKFDAQKKYQEIVEKEIMIITQEDSFYPSSIINIPDPPICLYVKGDIKKYNFDEGFYFAVVGTRKPSPYGQQITKMFSLKLAETGATIVSGLAQGIDTIAHQSALNCHGKTVAFLGCGVDIVYPPGNRKLYEQIIKENGLVISEFPPGRTVLPGLFIARNRLISGLSKGVLVVEGTNKSGALITAKYAALQGKEVFAPPVPLTSELSEAPNILLKQGAVLATSVEDILNEFNLKAAPSKKEVNLTLTADEKKIYDCLSFQPLNADDLALECKTQIHNLLPLLSIMEVKKIIDRNEEGKFQLRDF
ncbi:MAG: DNA-protecting protein DprA [Candidatus Roizmanbacteria bacterium]|nr:MAG: DNA-protecting protein DprA [Candidatus Roizmanbacteria bacterium]